MVNRATGLGPQPCGCCALSRHVWDEEKTFSFTEGGLGGLESGLGSESWLESRWKFHRNQCTEISGEVGLGR